MLLFQYVRVLGSNIVSMFLSLICTFQCRFHLAMELVFLLVQLLDLFSECFQLLLEFILVRLGDLLFGQLWDGRLFGHVTSVPLILRSVLTLSALLGLLAWLLTMLLMPFLLFFGYFVQVLFLLGQGLFRIDQALLNIVLGHVLLHVVLRLYILKFYVDINIKFYPRILYLLSTKYHLKDEEKTTKLS